MNEQSGSTFFRWTAGALLSAALLAILPASAISPLRDIVRTAFQPGQRVTQSVASVVHERYAGWLSRQVSARDTEIHRLRTQLAASREERRAAMMAAHQSVHELAELKQSGGMPGGVRTVSVDPLLQMQTVQARIVGREVLAALRGQRMLDQGTRSGLQTDQWVLESDRTVIDAGQEQTLAAGQPVLSGRCVVGRIADAGRQTSTMALITDLEFRTRAVLVKESSNRLTFGEIGILEGTGEGTCRLTQIPATEFVKPGDAVYSTVDPPLTENFLFGHVVAATLDADALHWNVTVQPAIDPAKITRVQIAVPALTINRALHIAPSASE